MRKNKVGENSKIQYRDIYNMQCNAKKVYMSENSSNTIHIKAMLLLSLYTVEYYSWNLPK